jgi:hypothetical protein
VATLAVRTQTRNGGGNGTYLNRLQDRRASFYLNRPPTFSGSLSADSGNAVSLGVRPGIDECLVLRDGVPLESVFACTQNRIAAGVNETRVEVEWQGIASYLADGVVLGQATPYSSTTLPWTWINSFQSRTGGSVYALTAGTTSGAAPTRQATVEADAGLLDKIIELSESSTGFDWNIDTNRALNLWYPTRGVSNGLVFEYGVNVTDYSYTEDAGPGEIVTDLRVIGPPGGGGVAGVATATNATAQATYGRREASASFFADFEAASVTQSQLQAHADRIIAERIRPIIIPSLTLRTSSGVGHTSVPWGSYWLGDTVRFRAVVGAFGVIDASYRIVAIHVSWDENDNETIAIEVNAA